MIRYISKYDDESYTCMLKLINSLGGRSLKYNWLISDIEAYPSDESFYDKLDEYSLFLTNDELLDMLEKEDFQWIWGVFSAIPLSIEKRDALQYDFPSIDKTSLSYKSSILIQHPLADIEIDCVDSSYFGIIFKDNKLEKNFLKKYPKALESSDCPEDYFTTWEGRTLNPTFEFSYYKMKRTFFIKNYYKKNYHEDSLHIYEDYFFDFMTKYHCIEEVTDKNGKKGDFSYFSPDNYYDKEQTKILLDEIKKKNFDHNKKIIKFLEKAIEEHDGFYIHGI